jgi:hypothetical protein
LSATRSAASGTLWAISWVIACCCKTCVPFDVHARTRKFWPKLKQLATILN